MARAAAPPAPPPLPFAVGRVSRRLPALLLLGLLAAACRPPSPPPQFVHRVDVSGAEGVTSDDVARKLASQEPRGPMRWTRGIPIVGYVSTATVRYQRFDRFVLQRDMERTRRVYRSRGFYEAQVRASRVVEVHDHEAFVCRRCGLRHRTSVTHCPTTVERLDPGDRLPDKPPVRVEIEVVEGAPVVIERADLRFVEPPEALPMSAAMYALVDELATADAHPTETIVHRHGERPAPAAYVHRDGDSFRGRVTLADGRRCPATLRTAPGKRWEDVLGELTGCGLKVTIAQPEPGAVAPCSLAPEKATCALEAASAAGELLSLRFAGVRVGQPGKLRAEAYRHRAGDVFRGSLRVGARACSGELVVASDDWDESYGMLVGCGLEERLARGAACELDSREARCSLSVTVAGEPLPVRFVGGRIESRPRFEESRYDHVKQRLQRLMTDHGYAHAHLEATARVDLERHAAELVFDADTGPACTFGPIRFESPGEEGGWVSGAGEIPESKLRARLGFAQADRYSTASIDTARRELIELGVFGSVDVIPELASVDGTFRTEVPVVVRVTAVKLRGIKAGVGAELGLRVEAHGVLGWEDRNFLGGLRSFAVEGRGGAVIFPLRVTNLFSQGVTDVVPETEASIRFKQPSFPEARTDMLLDATHKLYAPDIVTIPDDVTEDYNIVLYNELLGSFGFARRLRLPAISSAPGLRDYLGTSRVDLTGFIRMQLALPFSYNQDDVPDGYSRVLIPYLHSRVSWDLRKGRGGEPDALAPHTGLYLATDAQLAELGDARDLRIQPEVRVFAPLSDEVTVALRWTAGFLFPFNYGDSLQGDISARDLQLLSFRAFFSGGPSSNRGYGYRKVGPHAPSALDAAQLLPTGGLGLWEASAEIRIPVLQSHDTVPPSDELNIVVFADASDVVRTLGDFRFTHPHLSPGVGLRYQTPLGRLRADVAYRVPYLQRLGERVLEPEEGGPADGAMEDFPVAVTLALGEAF